MLSVQPVSFHSPPSVTICAGRIMKITAFLNLCYLNESLILGFIVSAVAISTELMTG